MARKTGDIQDTGDGGFVNTGKVKARDIIISTGLDEKALEEMLRILTDRLVTEMSAIDKDVKESKESIKELVDSEVVGRLCAIEERQATTEKDIIKAIKAEFSALQKDENMRDLIDDVIAQLRGQIADNRSILESIQALCEQSAQNANRQFEQFRAWQEKRAEEYRKKLHEATHEQNIKTGLVLRYAQQILEIIPNDVLANFYIFVSEHESESSAVNAYLDRLDVEDQEGKTICEMLDYLIEPLEPRMKDALRYLADRAFQQRKFNRGKYEHYISAIEEGKSFDPLKQWDLFIAYSNKDRAEVENLVNELKKQEIECFVSYRDLPHGRGAGGENYWAMLKTAMDHSRGIVFVSTPNSRSRTCDAIQREDRKVDNGIGELPYFEKNFKREEKIRIEYRPKSDYDAFTPGPVKQLLKKFFGDVNYCQTPAEVADKASRFLFPELYSHEADSKPEPKPVVVSKPEPTPKPKPAPAVAPESKTEHKVIHYVNGDVYEGKFKDNKPNGHGVYRYANGDVFEGEFKDGKRNGHGVYRFVSGNEYEGEFKDGKANGHGVFRFANGDVHEVEYKDGKLTKHQKKRKEAEDQQELSLASDYPTLENYDKTEFEIEGDVLKRHIWKTTEVKIPFGVKEIGGYAFFGYYGAISLTSLEIPDSVISIGNFAFSCNRLLKSIEIPNSVESIGSGAFAGCSSLKSIEIPNSVKSIGDSAFNGCSSLEIVEIPDSVTSIGRNAFYGTAYYNDQSRWDASGVLYIGNHLIEVKSALTGRYAIRASTKTIRAWAFYNCSSLKSIEIPNSVESIGSGTFALCSSLKSITVPDSVTSIGSDAFRACSSLESIKIPDGVTSIRSDAFHGCSSLKGIVIPNSVKSIGSDAFFGCASLKSITVPDSVTSIGSGAFVSCRSLASITVPDSVTSIGERAFMDCSSLESIEIPERVSSIERGAFYGCSSLESIEISEGVSSIEWGAFYGCSSLKGIVIPNSVTLIGCDAFLGCASLTIYCEAREKPIGWNKDWNPDNRPVVWGYKK